MVSRRILNTLVWTFSAALLALPGGATSAQQKMNSLDLGRARQMLRDARDAVKKNYYDPKYHGLDLDARYQQFDARIQAAPGLDEGFRMVAAFLSGLKDSHVFFEPPYRPYRLDYGFRMELIGNDAFVTRVRPGTDAETKVHPGDQITGYDRYSVNRTDFRDLSYTFNTLMPQMKTQLDLRDPDGKDREVIVESKVQQGRKLLDFTAQGSGDDIWRYLRAVEDEDHVVRQRWVEMGDVMIWKMPEFFLDNEGVDHIFDIARKHQALILDLRQNSGGAVTTLERMVANVMDHDVKISDRVGRKEMKPQMAKSVGSRAFKGKLIVLVDSQSASAAELFARVVQLEHRGIVLGDKTSGSVMEAKAYGYSQGLDTIIAYGFSITDADLIMKDGNSLEHVGVTPDELILPTGRDLATGQDPVMARAVELAGGQLNPEQAGKLFPYEWLPL